MRDYDCDCCKVCQSKPPVSDPIPGEGFTNKYDEQSNDDKSDERHMHEQGDVGGQQIKSACIHRRLLDTSEQPLPCFRLCVEKQAQQAAIGQHGLYERHQVASVLVQFDPGNAVVLTDIELAEYAG